MMMIVFTDIIYISEKYTQKWSPQSSDYQFIFVTYLTAASEGNFVSVLP